MVRTVASTTPPTISCPSPDSPTAKVSNPSMSFWMYSWKVELTVVLGVGIIIDDAAALGARLEGELVGLAEFCEGDLPAPAARDVDTPDPNPLVMAAGFGDAPADKLPEGKALGLEAVKAPGFPVPLLETASGALVNGLASEPLLLLMSPGLEVPGMFELAGDPLLDVT